MPRDRAAVRAAPSARRLWAPGTLAPSARVGPVTSGPRRDAAYVALAELLPAPLVTADARLASAPGLACSVEVLRKSP